MTLSLKKQVEEASVNAEISLKKLGLTDTKANVVLALDVSGSMSNMYSNKSVQEFVIRILGLAKKFHISNKIDVYAFGTKAGYIGEFDIDNITSKQISNVYDKSTLGASTNFTELFTMISDKNRFAKLITPNNIVKINWFKRFICKLLKIPLSYTEEVSNIKDNENIKVPTYAIVMTDGEPSDRYLAIQKISEISKYPIFFQFVAVSTTPIEFLDNLDTLDDRYVDNANVLYSDTPNSLSDTKLYDGLLQEYPSYLQKIKQLKMI